MSSSKIHAILLTIAGLAGAIAASSAFQSSPTISHSLGGILGIIAVVTAYLAKSPLFGDDSGGGTDAAKKVPSFLLLVGLGALLATSSTGCATGGLSANTIQNDIQDAHLALDAVQLFESAYFSAHPDVAVQAKVVTALTDAYTALDTAVKTLGGITDASQGQLDAAFASFEQAYQDVISLVQAFGYKTNSKLIMIHA